MKAIKGLGILCLFVSAILLTPLRHKEVSKPVVKLGIDVLEERGFDILQGKRIGILTNQAGVNSRGELTWKILKNAPNVNLEVILAPVHGLKGQFMAYETFYNDEIEGIPIYSVYASNSKPKDVWLRGLDAVVVDLQGIGIRCYNYWVFMVYTMVACFEKNIELIILDRPNPLGGHYVGGPIMESDNTSIWGPIEDMPLFHGLTIGELAQFVQMSNRDIAARKRIETGVIFPGLSCSKEVLKKGKLTVVPMEGWKRSMLWQDTKLPWVQTSPNIANLQSAYEFVFWELGRLVSANHGLDNCSFLTIEIDWANSLPFHRFSSKFVISHRIIEFIYANCPGHPKGYTLTINKRNKNIIEINIKDIRKVSPGIFGLTLLALSQKYSKFYSDSEENHSHLGAEIGDNELVEKLFSMEHINPQYFKDKWHTSALQFIEKTKSFHLYE